MLIHNEIPPDQTNNVQTLMLAIKEKDTQMVDELTKSDEFISSLDSLKLSSIISSLSARGWNEKLISRLLPLIIKIHKDNGKDVRNKLKGFLHQFVLLRNINVVKLLIDTYIAEGGKEFSWLEARDVMVKISSKMKNDEKFTQDIYDLFEEY